MPIYNPFIYNRDLSISEEYDYIDMMEFTAPIYGSSVSFASRLNRLETINNTLKILPASENSLVIKYFLKYILTDKECGDLLKTIEVAGGYRYLKFKDYSGFYSDMVGFVEDYTVNKNSRNINEVNIVINCYIKAPIFKWSTSSILSEDYTKDLIYDQSKNYKKYSFVYKQPPYAGENRKKIRNFLFAKEDIQAGSAFDITKWTENFIYDLKINLDIKNKFDFFQFDYRNSFVQNVKNKNNSNTLTSFPLNFENIDDDQCKSMLFFLEKKCGYMRFIYEYPIFFKKNKVFICTDWTHTLKYKNCNDLSITLIEDPEPVVKRDLSTGIFFIE